MGVRRLRVLASGRWTGWQVHVRADGVAEARQHRSETVTYRVDWTRWLEAGETLQGVTVSAGGATTSVTGSGAVWRVNVAAVTERADVDVVATTSAGRVWARRVRVLERDDEESLGAGGERHEPAHGVWGTSYH